VAGQFFVNGLMMASFVARAPQLRDQIGVSVDRFGLLLTVATSVGLLASAAAGRVIHHFGTRRVLQVGVVITTITMPLIGAAPGPAWWLAAMMTYMFVDLFIDIAMNLQGSWISARRHTPVMNRLHGVWSLGTFAGGLGAVAANAAGLSPFTHLAVVGVVVAGLLVVIMRNLLPTDETAHDDAPTPAVPRSGRARLLPIVLLALAGMFASVGEAAPGDWATFRLTDDFGAPGALGSAAFAALTIGMTAMRFGGDSLQVRLGRLGLRRAAIAVTAAGVLLATLVDVAAVAVVGFAVVGLGVATFMPTLYDDAARLPGRRGAGLGALTAGMRISFLGSPVAIGALAATSLSVGDAIAIMTLPAMLGLAVVSEWNERLLRRRASTGAD
jgi:MFS family permease